MQLAVTSAVSTVHIFYAPYMCTNNFTVSISNYEVRWTPRACKPHIPLNLAWFLQFVFLHLCLLSKSLWSRLKSIFSKSGEVKFPPSRRLKSTWRHSKSKTGQITLWRVTPRSSRLGRACTLLRGLNLRGYFAPYCILAISGNSPT